MVRRFQFRLRSIMWLTAVAAVACLVGPPAVEQAPKHFFATWQENLAQRILAQAQARSATHAD